MRRGFTGMSLRQALKAHARRVVAGALSIAPPFVSNAARGIIEKIVFNNVPAVDNLPPIFHYWSNKFLRPQFESIGYASPNDFFLKTVEQKVQAGPDRVRVLSVGAGRCEMELSLAKNLLDRGMRNFSFACMDLNGRMLRTAAAEAAKLGIESKFAFVQKDIARFKAVEKYDVVIANQCLHHFVALEAAFDSIRASMSEGGSFITSDVIGRNGHQLWPEAVEEVLELWQTLPSRYKYDRTLGRLSEAYVNYNHANVGFEGIRAQDILPLLIERFEFEVFAPHACIILPFVERRFGWNFNIDEQSDRDFIDRVAMRDETLLASGKLKPTQLLARMSSAPVRDYVSTCVFSPRDCIRWPD